MGCRWVRTIAHPQGSVNKLMPVSFHNRTSLVTTTPARLRTASRALREYSAFFFFLFAMYLNLVRHRVLFSLPMGVYGTSTYKQGATPVPAAHPAPQSTNCKTLPTVTLGPAVARRDEKVVKRVAAPFPGATPLP